MTEPLYGRWHVEARLRLADGSERVEDLGVHVATTGRKAKARAIALHAGRMGWSGTTRGIITRPWYFRIQLERATEVHLGCGGTVRLQHETWTCERCGATDVPVSAVRHAVTADTITDDQIRALGGPGCDRAVRRLCKIALNDAPTYLKASVVRDARQRCADILNDKARKGAG